MSAHSAPALAAVASEAVTTSTARPPREVWKALASHLLIPLFLGIGMAFAYLGAFHAPTPSHLPLAIVGDTAATKVFAQTMNDRAGDRADVRTVATSDEARRMVHDGDLAAAYLPAADHAELIVATAQSPTVVAVAQDVFLPIAYAQHLPLKLDDVAPVRHDDGSGQGLFFLMVALTVGAYAAVAAISAVAGRLAVLWRVAVSAAVSLAISAIGCLVAGPVFHVLDQGVWGIWLMSWLYVFGIVSIGVGLHPVLGKWTTPVLVALFVMLNITTSGGVFPHALMPPFFAGLSTFWNGAAWLSSAQALAYFPGRAFGWEGLRLALWAAAGISLIVVTHLLSVRRRRIADDTITVDALEEEQAAVAA